MDYWYIQQPIYPENYAEWKKSIPKGYYCIIPFLWNSWNDKIIEMMNRFIIVWAYREAGSMREVTGALKVKQEGLL